ncbi:hypothetical protein E2C01_037012 [Portunus trituberculatus]|uniref:Uncharacterized protein n=1 Tax=Portunus trituberculatus TaxID=210409 RepID=A0A5B7FCT4_PORTR|nr:hypothetical protein [Portunus trituberculatus]
MKRLEYMLVSAVPGVVASVVWCGLVLCSTPPTGHGQNTVREGHLIKIRRDVRRISRRKDRDHSHSPPDQHFGLSQILFRVWREVVVVVVVVVVMVVVGRAALGWVVGVCTGA